MQRNVKRLSPAIASAIFSYLFSGGTVNRYATGARALPPSYSDSDHKRPRFYCIHAPLAAVAVTVALAGAAQAQAACYSSDPDSHACHVLAALAELPIYSVYVYTPSGDSYVTDYGLSLTDCRGEADKQRKAKPRGFDVTCKRD